jgi:hypothetical protein
LLPAGGRAAAAQLRGRLWHPAARSGDQPSAPSSAPTCRRCPKWAGDDVTYFAPDEDPGHVAAAIAARLEASAAYRFAVRARQHYTWRQVYENNIAPLLRSLTPDQEEDHFETVA